MVSHQLLYRAGFIREVIAGRYILTPFGFRVLRKIIGVIDAEMEKIGSQRVILPTLHPIEIWKATHRDEVWGEGLMRLKDRRGADLVLGATAEGLMVELVKMFTPTYKDLPIVVHQFSQKFRDELRARGGLLRLREFMMKDAYSFAGDEAQFMETYNDQLKAYERIAGTLGLSVIPVEADSGALGGDFCHEFMVLNDNGDDRIFICDRCGYKANLEKAKFIRENINEHEKEEPLKIVQQPEWVKTMADNEKHYKLPANRFLKNVVYKTNKGELIIVVLRGDLDVNEVKLEKLVNKGPLHPATEVDLGSIGTRAGWVHSWGHKATYVGDLSLKTVKNFIGGQKSKDSDAINVNFDRNFKVDILGDVALAFAGAICGECERGKLMEKRTIEFGHCFKYDDFYTKAQGGVFTDKDGKEKLLQMGAFGIGVERAMALIVESNHDEKGITWPEGVAPYKIHLISLRSEDSNVKKTAEKIYSDLEKAGIEVLFDDREDVSAGVKFSDSDLIGIPYRVVVSEKSLLAGGIELKKRKESESKIVTQDELLTIIKST